MHIEYWSLKNLIKWHVSFTKETNFWKLIVIFEVISLGLLLYSIEVLYGFHKEIKKIKRILKKFTWVENKNSLPSSIYIAFQLFILFYVFYVKIQVIMTNDQIIEGNSTRKNNHFYKKTEKPCKNIKTVNTFWEYCMNFCKIKEA